MNEIRDWWNPRKDAILIALFMATILYGGAALLFVLGVK